MLALSKKANGTPLAWRETDDLLIITFEDGRKLTFSPLPDPAGQDPDPAALSGAARPSAAQSKGTPQPPADPAGRVAGDLPAYRDPDPADQPPAGQDPAPAALSGAAHPERSETKSKGPTTRKRKTSKNP